MKTIQVLLTVVILTAFGGRAYADLDLVPTCNALVASLPQNVVSVNCALAAPFLAARLNAAGFAMENIADFLSTATFDDGFCANAETFLKQSVFGSAVTLTDCDKLKAALKQARDTGGIIYQITLTFSSNLHYSTYPIFSQYAS